MIKILFFAGMKEQAGTSEYTLEASEATIAELRDKVKEAFPQMSGTEKVMVAVNEEFTIDEDVVHAGDTVAFIPPVSGG